MAGGHLEPRRSRPVSQPVSRPLSPVRERRLPDRVRDITELLERIHDLAVSQGFSGTVMATWEIGMIRLCIGEGDLHPAFLFENQLVESFLVELRGMERQLHNDPRRAFERNIETGDLQLAKHYTVNGFKTSIETGDPLAFQVSYSIPSATPQHSLARHSRVSGRYAAMMGLGTDGVARDGGYRFARF
ncbi:hypothetical protein JCM5353_001976 [Sporobolomyces roseus]